MKEDFSYYSDSVNYIAGTDEAGRGPLAGPVVIAAVIFPKDYRNEEIDDSKKLSASKREELYKEIIENALTYAVVFVSADEIDKSNIYKCAQLGMEKAINSLSVKPDLVLSDAMPLPRLEMKVIPLVKGDARCQNIAAASILAKVERDRYMDELEKKYPNYKFSSHKGYGTKEHLEELNKYGPIEGVHRKTYAPVKKFYSEQLKLF